MIPFPVPTHSVRGDALAGARSRIPARHGGGFLAMNGWWTGASLVVLCALAPGCGGSGASSAADDERARADIAAAQRAWSAALVDDDVDALLAMYAEDAV